MRPSYAASCTGERARTVVRRQYRRGEPGPAAPPHSRRRAADTPPSPEPGEQATQRRPMIPMTAGAFCSTTETRNPARASASEVFFTMLGTSSERLAS